MAPPRYAPPPYPDYGWGPADGSASPHQEAVPAMPPLESTPTNTSSSDTSFSDIAFMLQMLDHQNNPVGDPQTHYITPKVEPSSYPPHQASPPPYPGSEMLSQSPSQARTSTFGSLSRSCCCNPPSTATTSTGSTGRRASSRSLTRSRWPPCGERERTDQR